MESEDARVAITCIVELLTIILAEAMPNLTIKLLFIVFVSVEIVLYFKYKNIQSIKDKMPMYIIGCIIVIMLLISIVDTDSFTGFVQIKEFFSSEPSETVDYISIIEGQNDEIDQKIKEVNDKMADSINAFKEVSNDFSRYGFLYAKENQQEIETILQKMIDINNENSDAFPNLKTNKHEIELFYKGKLTEEPYFYCNIIKAFEAYGINCKELSIDEYVLMLWDTQCLYIIYSMKKDLEDDLKSNTFFDERSFDYNDYKINMNENSDTFDYEDWRYTYTNKTAKEISKEMSNIIINYYKKFSMNFRDNKN